MTIYISINNNEINKLVKLGDSKKQANVIINKVPSKYIKKVFEIGYDESLLELINKKNNNLQEYDNFFDNIKNDDKKQNTNDKLNNNIFKNRPYYIANNLERYKKLYNKNPNMDLDLIIALVNVNADNEAYTNVVNTDLNKGLLILVNKFNKLSPNYEPENLVSLGEYGVGEVIDVVKDAFVKMVKDAEKENIILRSVSSYRSYSEQEILHDIYIKNDGIKKANTYSARPGYSEHQTGLAIDINLTNDSFINTKEAKWLANNAYKYGFILRYPKDKEKITGYKYEPWHYRYVGEEVAKFIYENDITFDEYYAYYLK